MKITVRSVADGFTGHGGNIPDCFFYLWEKNTTFVAECTEEMARASLNQGIS